MLGRTKNTRSIVFKINSRQIDNPKQKANEFNEYYTNIPNSVVNSLPRTDAQFEDFLPPRHPTDIQWEPTAHIEIRDIIKKCNNATPGPNGIPMQIFTKNSEVLSSIISQLCNKSLEAEVFPSMYKKGRVIPIHKEKLDIGNYRPIVMLNAIKSKIKCN